MMCHAGAWRKLWGAGQARTAGEAVPWTCRKGDFLMTRGTLLRTAAAALLAAHLLAPPAALAQDRPSAAARADGGGLLAQVWSFLTGLVPPGELDNRCGIDPNGGLACADAGALPDNRCSIDPDGRASCEPGV